MKRENVTTECIFEESIQKLYRLNTKIEDIILELERLNNDVYCSNTINNCIEHFKWKNNLFELTQKLQQAYLLFINGVDD